MPASTDDPEVAHALAVRHEEAARRLAALTGRFEEVVAASVDSNADDEHDPEGATIAFERSQIDALARRTVVELREIEAAQRRLDDGRYGRCESCDRPIPVERLQARPVARTCVDCAQRGTARRGTLQQGTAQQGTARHGAEERGTAGADRP